MTATFPLNAWYAAAWDVELGRELLARTICEEEMVLYRKQDGSPVALENACWHRRLPLSRGRLDGDDLVCGYHGLVYSPAGRCIQLRAEGKVPSTACVRSFPVLQRHRLVWVWPGDPALADPALVPDLHWADDPAWAADGQRFAVHCDYRLLVDNLMDLSHETFVHGSSIGHRSVAESPFVAASDGRFATLERWMSGVEAPPFWAEQLRQARGHAGPVDRWQRIRFEPPCTVTIDVGVAPAGSGAAEGDRSAGVNGYVLNHITPETATSCHYFWAFARNYRLGEQRLTHELREGVARIFREDEAVLEAQQRRLDAHPEQPLNNLAIDAGGVRARRLIAAMIAREQAHGALQHAA